MELEFCRVEHLSSMCRALGLILKKENNFFKEEIFLKIKRIKLSSEKTMLAVKTQMTSNTR